MAQDVFLKIEGLKGEAKDTVHKDEIDVLSWSWGMSQSGTMHVGGGGGGGKVAIQDMNVVKYVDKSSTELMLRCCSGKHFPSATLTVRKAGDKPLEYMVVSLTDVLIAHVSTGGTGDNDRLTEQVTLNFAKVKVKYQEQSQTGGVASSPEMTWDIQTNQPG